MSNQLPTSQQLDKHFAQATAELNDRLTADMLDRANQKCFRMCFINGSGASTMGSSVTGEQKQCMTNCLDKFLEAREMAFKKVLNM